MKEGLIALATALLGGMGTASAQTQVLPIAITEVSLATPEDATEVLYYVLELPELSVPVDARFAEAYLDFFMDATSTLPADLIDGVVTLEVYPFPGTTSGRLDTSKLGVSSMKRTVALGDSRRVRVYVTEFVRRIIAEPSADRSLIVGSVVGQRIARFAAKTIPGAAGAKATLTVQFSRIEDTTTGQGVLN